MANNKATFTQQRASAPSGDLFRTPKLHHSPKIGDLADFPAVALKINWFSAFAEVSGTLRSPPSSGTLISDTTPTEVRHMSLRAHLPAPRLPARHTPACAMPAMPPSSHRTSYPHALACHAATAQPACLRRDSATPRLLGPATLHLRLQCFAVGGPHAWRAISALPPVANPLSLPPPPRASDTQLQGVITFTATHHRAPCC